MWTLAADVLVFWIVAAVASPPEAPLVIAGNTATGVSTSGTWIARLWSAPPAIAVTVVPEGRLTWTGVLLLMVKLPLPSWPSLLRPQARIWPVELSARLCCAPPARAVTVVPEGRLTWTGVLLLLVLPLPSWPLTL